jgi:SAM-dependent methyltransferase
MNHFIEVSNYLDEARNSQWEDKQVKARFEEEPAPDYGEHMQKWIPGYDEAHALILDALRLHLPPASRLLDLGAGTGRVSKMILNSFDDCYISLTDFSANMLAEAPRKLAAYDGRFDTKSVTFLVRQWITPKDRSMQLFQCLPYVTVAGRQFIWLCIAKFSAGSNQVDCSSATTTY